MDWGAIVKASQEAFRVAVNEWINGARVQGGTVRGPSAVLTPGSIVSKVSIESRMLQILEPSRAAPREIFAALAKVLASAWNEWAGGFQIQLPKAYPAFAAFPGNRAPLTPSVAAAPLSQGSSSGEAGLKAPSLANKLNAAVRVQAALGRQPLDEKAIANLAKWVGESFDEWKNLVKLTGLVGQGDVPTFAPPYVPVGPVTAGENMSVSSPFAGPRFGKVVF